MCIRDSLRGVDFVQIPTTLLAQVDSSVGGKVAVDLKSGKNLAGAFWQPKLVLMDPECLNTLSDRIFNDGMAEVIKYGCIRDAEFFDELLKCGGREGVMGRIEYVLETCCAIKAPVSYTHLDVYKRQDLRCCCWCFPQGWGHPHLIRYPCLLYTSSE